MVDKIKVIQAEEEKEEAYDTADPTSVNKARKRAARTRADRLHFVAAAMTTEQGRSWFYDYLRRCHLFSTPYIAGDPYATAFRAGEQNMGLQVLSDIQEAAPSEYLQMITENKTKNG